MSKAVFPGSFDPVTKGHLDIIFRVCRVFDFLCIVVANNVSKEYVFTIQERRKMLESVLLIHGLDKKVLVYVLDGLLINFLKKMDLNVIVRGIRSAGDMDFEWQGARINACLRDGVETLFLPSGSGYEHISSGMVKEVYRLGGNVEAFVPGLVLKELEVKLRG